MSVPDVLDVLDVPDVPDVRDVPNVQSMTRATMGTAALMCTVSIFARSSLVEACDMMADERCRTSQLSHRAT